MRVFCALLGWVPLVPDGGREVSALLEMDADDAARHEAGDAALFDALLALTGARSPHLATAGQSGSRPGVRIIAEGCLRI